MGYADEPYNTTTHLLWFMGAQVAPDADPRYTWTPTSLGWWSGVLKGESSGGSSAVAQSATTGVNPVETHYSIWGHTIPIHVFGVGRIGGELISGPVQENGKVYGGVSFGFPADPTGTRTLREISFDSEVVWEGTAVGDPSGPVTIDASGFNTEPFTCRFYSGSLTQSADPLETSWYGVKANAYRPQTMLFIDGLPLANTKFKKFPYVSCKFSDSSGDDVNLGEAFERLAYSPWVGFTSAEFETSGVTDGLVSGGLIITQDSEFLSLIQQFGRFYPSWDILQTDKLRIVDRGDNITPDISLDKTRLMGQVVFARAEPNSIPRKLILSTPDPGADYTIVPSEAAFPNDPVNVSSSIRTESAYLPAIMDASTRMAVVTFAKYQEEQARKKITGVAMTYGLEMEPGDLIGLSGLGDDFPGGEVFKVKETLHGANYSVEFTGESIIQCAPGAITTPPPPEPDAAGFWNAADKSVGITLSNSDQTATQITTVTGGVRSTTAHTTGKYYVELVVGTFTGYIFDDDGIGITTLAQSLATIPAGASFYIRGDGLLYVGGVSTTIGANGIQNTTIGLAIDLDHQRMWVRNNNNFNAWIGTSGSGSANPVTNTQGFDISAVFSGVAAYLFMSTDNATTDVVTINNTWTYAPPTGFGAW